MPMPQPGTCTADDYWSLPQGERAELIDGELVDLASPGRRHQRIVSKLDHAFESFIESSDGACQVYPAPFAVNLFGDNSTFVEPDLSVVCDLSKLSDRGCEGAPDLVIEVVSPTSRTADYVKKLDLYLTAGVREYWICDPQRCCTVAYHLEEDSVAIFYPFDVSVPSSIFPGLQVRFADFDDGM